MNFIRVFDTRHAPNQKRPWGRCWASIDLKLNNLDLSGSTTEFKTLPTRPRSHRYKLFYIFAMEKSVKICRFKTFWIRIFARGTLLLNVSIYMLKCVFCRDIVREENEFKRCVYLDTNSNSWRWSLSKFVVPKHLWWEFLHGEPCFLLDILV